MIMLPVAAIEDVQQVWTAQAAAHTSWIASAPFGEAGALHVAFEPNHAATTASQPTSPGSRATAAHSRSPRSVPTVEVSAPGVIDTTFPNIETRLPNGVKLLPEVRYRTLEGFRPLTMDIYLPAAAAKRPASGYPMVMFIHGGSWARGDSHASRPLRNFPLLLADIAARGYVVTSINYRLVGEAPWPAQGQDVKAAIRFLRLHAADYGIDPQRFATWGASAGGHLSAIAAASGDVAALKPDDAALAAVSDRVQAAVSWYGGFNMASIAEQARAAGAISRDDARAPEWRLLGCFKDQCTPEAVRSVSPVSYVQRDMPPMLLVVGDKDTLIPTQQSLEMAEQMTEVGAKVELLVLPDVGHDFAGATQEVTRAANQRALDATLRFLDRLFYPVR